MRVKVCGLTRIEDALSAAALGADALGFVLWPRSPRAVAVSRLREIVAALPPFVTPVGVFVDPEPDDVLEAWTAGMHVAQIHGRAPDLPDGPPVLRAVHLAEEGDGIVPDMAGTGAVLLDAYDPVTRGGTGRTVDWTRAATVARTRPVVLAGGLTPDNVAEAIRVVRPYAVDVSAGVECRPGIKDEAKLAAFLAAAKAGV